MSRQRGDPHARALVKRCLIGKMKNSACRDGGEFLSRTAHGIPVTREYHPDTVAYGETFNVCSDLRDNARAVVVWDGDVGTSADVPARPLSTLRIGRVDARAYDLDHDFAGGRLWPRDGDESKNIRGAVLGIHHSLRGRSHDSIIGLG